MKPGRIVLACLLLFAAACAQPVAKERNQPGAFDYYLLALSWSPEYCAGPAGASSEEQCGEFRRFAFVVHGLWPQYETGWPQNCDAARPVDPALVESMLPVMPSSRLIQHEWDKHGTCSGLTQKEYFAEARRAFESVKVPEDFKQPLAQVMVAPAEIRKKFLAANPDLLADAVRVNCKGRYLSEVQVCLTKDLRARACGSDVVDRCAESPVIMRPLR